MFRGILKLIRWGVILMAVATIFLALSAPFYLYQRYDAEYPVAKLVFHQLGHQQYRAEIRSGDFCYQQTALIYGDQWRLDATVLKWKGIAVVLGFEPKYRLERLSGRYKNINEQNSKRQLSHQLNPEIWLDIFALDDLLGQSNRLVDTVFGSSVYLDIDPTRSYTVYMTEDALIAKSQPLPKVDFDRRVVTIEINNACGKEPQTIDWLTAQVNRLAVRYLGVMGG